MTVKNKDIKNLAGAILLVEVPQEKVGKGPFFTGSGFSVPINKAQHVLTHDNWYEENEGDRKGLGVETTHSEKFGGYLASSNPKSLHPSFKGKNLQQILDYYIDNNNNVINESGRVRSEIVQVGYVPLKDRDGRENDQKDHLSTDVDYGMKRVYLTLKEYAKLGKPKLLKKIISVEPVQAE